MFIMNRYPSNKFFSILDCNISIQLESNEFQITEIETELIEHPAISHLLYRAFIYLKLFIEEMKFNSID